LAGAIVGVLSLPDRGASLGIAGRQRVDVKYQWRQGVEDLLRLAAKLER
jgi:hypothetical protein